MTELPNSTYADYNAGPLYTADQMHAYADAENAALREINSALCTKSNGYVADNARLSERVKVLEDALEKLACLGNGDRHGNSIGNDIASAARKGKT